MKRIVVDIADCRVSDDPDAVLCTFALGSCLAVAVHDPRRTVGGLLHFMLPERPADSDRARRNPAMYGDTGVALLFKQMCSHGCQKQDLVVKVVGGASLNDGKVFFDIGRRNVTGLRKLFWESDVRVAASLVGGHQSRTVHLHVATGRVVVSTAGEEVEL